MQNSEETDLLQTLHQCEAGVWDALVDGNADADDAALHRDFLGVYPDGFANKADHLGQLVHGPSVAWYTLSDLTLKTLGDDYALLSYHAAFLRQEKSEPEAMYVSSIWQRAPTGWVNIFSQDTPSRN